MKTNIFAILLASIMLLVYNDATACPTGYTSITKTITVGDCDYNVDLCVKCPTGPVPGFITFTGFRLSNPNCENSLDINQVFEGIKAQISNHIFIWNLCAELQAPPCNEGWSSPITFYWFFCWNKEKVSYFEEDYIVYNACDYDNYCEETYVYCWNGNDYTSTRISGPTMHGVPYCPDQFYPDPKEYNQPTPCFQIDTNCN
ncbi:MAG: hypothetical protein KBA52_07910 [Candidatus Kapabacteria bacterium]|nr:hypothetical protein [Candidatus Kapabacteria bacterium]